MPYWMLGTLLLGLVGTSGALIHTVRSAPQPVAPLHRVAVAQSMSVGTVAETASVEAMISADAAMSEIERLQEQIRQLTLDLEQAQRDSALLHSLSQERSAELVTVQGALQAVEQWQQDELLDLRERLALLEQEIDAIERLGAEMRRLVGLPDAPIATGGPAQQPPGAFADPVEATRAEIGYALQRVQAMHGVLNELDQHARARLAWVSQSGAVRGGVSARDLAFSPFVPRGRPVDGPITSGFGDRISPFALPVAEDEDDAEPPEPVIEFHSGIDIAVPEGTPVRATGAGTVRLAGWAGGYGNLVIIDHGHGISTYYGHNSALLVTPGQTVEAGTIIAHAGTTGRSTGSHVHYEVRINDVPVDPRPYMQLAP